MPTREFPAETPTIATIASPCPDRYSITNAQVTPTKMAIYDDGLSPEAMLAFYQRLYPFKSIFHWLNHEPAPTRLFVNREFAFTLQGEVYLRYNSFANADELKKQVCTLNPTRFEIGPMYSARVSCVDPTSVVWVRQHQSRVCPHVFSRETRKQYGRPPLNPSNASSSSISI